MLDEIEGEDFLILRITYHHLNPIEQADFLFFFKSMTKKYMARPDRWFTVWRVL